MSEAPSSQPSDARQEYLSRRERRLRERARRSRDGMPRWLRRSLLWGGSLLALVLIGWGMLSLSGATQLPTGTGTLADPVTETDHTLGPSDAPVTLVEYSDFQCPACAAFAPIVKQALADAQLAGKVRLVYRSFPLTTIHPRAELAARAAEAASLQGRFWEMHDLLFERQQSWTRLSDSAAQEVFVGFASELGLDADAFTRALDDGAVRDRVREQSDSAGRSDVDATPTFFVNGTPMAPVRNYEEFRQNILNALNANS